MFYFYSAGAVENQPASQPNTVPEAQRKAMAMAQAEAMAEAQAQAQEQAQAALAHAQAQAQAKAQAQAQAQAHAQAQAQAKAKAQQIQQAQAMSRAQTPPVVSQGEATIQQAAMSGNGFNHQQQSNGKYGLENGPQRNISLSPGLPVNPSSPFL